MGLKYIELANMYRMANEGRDIKDLFPQRVKGQLKSLRSPPAIIEVSGRDAFASVIKAFENGDVESAFPVITYTPVLYGNWKQPRANVELLQKVIRDRFCKQVCDSIIVGDTDLWYALNGRYIQLIIERFGFYTPCVGCHLYFHTLHAIASKFLGSYLVVSGERESHDGCNKCLGSTHITIEHFRDFLVELGVKLIHPIRFISKGKDIERLIGWNWPQEQGQLSCILRFNHLNTKGEAIYYPERVQTYLEDFLLPVTRFFLQLRQQGTSNIQDKMNYIAGNLLKSDENK